MKRGRGKRYRIKERGYGWGEGRVRTSICKNVNNILRFVFGISETTIFIAV